MTSQAFAIFYLNDLDHFVKENLKIKYYVRYQDDFCLFHESKDYLKYCLKEIELFLHKEKLILNRKTRIYRNTNKYIFLGRTISNKKGNYREKNKKLKVRYKMYADKQISLYSYICSLS